MESKTTLSPQGTYIFNCVPPVGGGYHVAVFGDNRDKRKREKRGNDGKGRGCKNSLKKLDGNVGGGASWNNIAPTVF